MVPVIDTLSVKQAIECAPEIGFDKFIITATTPFRESDCAELIWNAPTILKRYCPLYKETFDKRGWKMFPNLSRVYDNKKAMEYLGWKPKYNFREALNLLHI